MKSLIITMVGALLLAPALLGQVVTIGTGTLTNLPGPSPWGTWPTPYGTFAAGARQQYLILATELQSNNMPAASINALGFDVVVPAGQPLQNFEIRMGHTTVQSLTAWVPGVTQVLNPTTHAATTGWNSHILNTPFAWDGSSNLVIEVCHWNGVGNWTVNTTVHQSQAGFNASLLHVNDNAPACPQPQYVTYGLNEPTRRPNMQFTYGPVWPAYQTNQPGSSLDINGVQGTSTAPAVTPTGCAGVAPLLTWSSTSSLPGDMWIQAGMPLPSTTTGLGTANGQVVNVNPPPAPGLWLLGGVSPNVTVPFISFGGFIASGGLALPASAQAFNLDTTNPDGASLSQPVALVAPAPPVAGPVGEDTFIQVFLNQPPLCHPGIAFYGTQYTDFFVSSNGQVTFNAGSTDFTPSLIEAMTGDPIAGGWVDLSPLLGGSISISAPGPTVRVDYTAVPYWTAPNVSATFGIEFDPSGDVAIRNVSGISVHPGADSMFLGISHGNQSSGGQASNPGQAGFQVGLNPGPPPGPDDMIYELNTAGTLAPGVTDILFLWGASTSSYNWQCL